MIEEPKEPEWDGGGMCYSSTGWKPDMIRRFPNPAGVKRRVKITFVTYKLATIGAKHYHVSIEPEENPVWDGDNWHTYGDDPEREATSALSEHNGNFTDRDKALRWVARVIKKKFSDYKPETYTTTEADFEQALEAAMASEPDGADPAELEEPPEPKCDYCFRLIAWHDKEELRACQSFLQACKCGHCRANHDEGGCEFCDNCNEFRRTL